MAFRAYDGSFPRVSYPERVKAVRPLLQVLALSLDPPIGLW